MVTVYLLCSLRDCREPTTLCNQMCGAWGCPLWSCQSDATPSLHQMLKNWRPYSDAQFWTVVREKCTALHPEPDHRVDLSAVSKSNTYTVKQYHSKRFHCVIMLKENSFINMLNVKSLSWLLFQVMALQWPSLNFWTT